MALVLQRSAGQSRHGPWLPTSIQIHDFAQLSENTYYVYHDTNDLRGEPHTVAVRGEDDVHVTEEVYKRPLFLWPTYRYKGPVPCRTPA